MAMKGKLEIVFELKASADEFYKVFKHTVHHIPNHTPTNIHAVELHEGEWHTPSCLKQWTYTIDGKKEVLKERMVLDDEKKTVTISGVDGEPMKLYKVYILELVVQPKEDGNGSCVILSLSYEKLNPTSPPPYKYLDFLESVILDISHAVHSAA